MRRVWPFLLWLLVLILINPSHTTGLFLCPLKTSWNFWLSDVFRAMEKTSRMKWVKKFFAWLEYCALNSVKKFGKSYEFFDWQYLNLIWLSLLKKWSFLLKISSVNVTNSTGNCGFGHISEEVLNGNLHILCSVCIDFRLENL